MAKSLPTKIDRYEVVDRIGRGGMSVVYRCRDPRIGRTVAIKVLTVPEDERFLQEARAVGSLHHENIVTIFDYGEYDDGPFIVMEYVEGATMADHLKRHTLIPLARKLRLLLELASALDYAHSFGIVHRDIKPANLMVDSHGMLKILDFGIARMVESPLTRVGDIVGTPNYMSPEQIEGRPVDRRTDVFAVGLTMYELLSGRKAFPGETMVRIATAILNEQPEPLSRLCPDLDPALAHIVERAIQKEPARRYDTLASMAADLARTMRAVGGPTGVSDAPPDAETMVTPTARPLPPPAIVGGQTSVPEPSHPPSSAAAYAGIAVMTVAVVAAFAAGLGILRSRPSPQAEPSRATPAAPAETVVPRSPPSAPEPSTPSPAKAPSRSSVRPPPASPKTTAAAEPASAPASKSETIRAGCEGGDAAKCVSLGQLYELGNGVGKDVSRAIGLYQKACDAGNGQGCNMAALVHVRGGAVPKDEPRAASFFQRACNHGYAGGCTNLGLMYVRAASVPKDDERAAMLFQKACEQGDGGGCGNLGHAQEFGLGVSKDLPKAVMSYQKSCAANAIGGCTSLGWMYFRGAGVEKDERRAVSLFERACDEGNTAGCNDLGLAYAQGRGVGKDEAKAATLYETSCNKNNLQACVNLGFMYVRGTSVAKDDARGTALFQRACDGNHPGGCVNAGFSYSTGRGVAKDELRAAGLYQRACDASFGDGCTRLAAMYEQGRGVAKDPARASALYQRGRDLIGKTQDENPAPRSAASAPAQPASAGTTVDPKGGGETKGPAKIKDVRPKYPVAARYARVEGIVVIEATVGADGTVTQTKVVRSIPLLDAAAEEAVKQWQYEPTKANGAATPIVLTVSVSFSLSDKQ